MDITPIGSEGINGAFVEYITVSRPETLENYATQPPANEKEPPVSLDHTDEKIEMTENPSQFSINSPVQTAPQKALNLSISSTPEKEEETSDIEIAKIVALFLKWKMEQNAPL